MTHFRHQAALPIRGWSRYDGSKGPSKYEPRNLIWAFGGAVAAWFTAGRAQQPTVSVIGFLSPRSPDESAHLVAAFRRGLGEAGLLEGQNASVEYRWTLGEYAKLPMLATELVSRQIDVLVTGRAFRDGRQGRDLNDPNRRIRLLHYQYHLSLRPLHRPHHPQRSFLLVRCSLPRARMPACLIGSTQPLNQPIKI